jgi:hypothetical protein
VETESYLGPDVHTYKVLFLSQIKAGKGMWKNLHCTEEKLACRPSSDPPYTQHIEYQVG